MTVGESPSVRATTVFTQPVHPQLGQFGQGGLHEVGQQGFVMGHARDIDQLRGERGDVGVEVENRAESTRLP